MKVATKLTKSSLVIIVFSIILVIILFFVVDCLRVSNNESPIFCISPFGKYLDGGTIEYFGLGYKIIDYNIIGGYHGFKIGTWFMKYNSYL